MSRKIDYAPSIARQCLDKFAVSILYNNHLTLTTSNPNQFQYLSNWFSLLSHLIQQATSKKIVVKKQPKYDFPLPYTAVFLAKFKTTIYFNQFSMLSSNAGVASNGAGVSVCSVGDVNNGVIADTSLGVGY